MPAVTGFPLCVVQLARIVMIVTQRLTPLTRNRIRLSHSHVKYRKKQPYFVVLE